MTPEKKMLFGRTFSWLGFGAGFGAAGVAIGEVLSTSSSLPNATGIVGALFGLRLGNTLFDELTSKSEHMTK